MNSGRLRVPVSEYLQSGQQANIVAREGENDEIEFDPQDVP